MRSLICREKHGRGLRRRDPKREICNFLFQGRVLLLAAPFHMKRTASDSRGKMFPSFDEVIVHKALAFIWEDLRDIIFLEERPSYADRSIPLGSRTCQVAAASDPLEMGSVVFPGNIFHKKHKTVTVTATARNCRVFATIGVTHPCVFPADAIECLRSTQKVRLQSDL